MKYLIDTPIFLWYALDDARLHITHKSLLNNSANVILFSPVSYWEIAVKVSLGKLKLSEPYEILISKAVTNMGFEILPILPAHTSELLKLPFLHRDPFDRLLIAQAIAEDLTMVSQDRAFDAYSLKRA